MHSGILGDAGAFNSPRALSKTWPPKMSELLRSRQPARANDIFKLKYNFHMVASSVVILKTVGVIVKSWSESMEDTTFVKAGLVGF